MNGVSMAGMSRGWPAIEVVRVTADRPTERRERSDVADEALLAGVAHPPRIGEARPIAALMPQVLARYGLAEAAGNHAAEGVTLDVLA